MVRGVRTVSGVMRGLVTPGARIVRSGVYLGSLPPRTVNVLLDGRRIWSFSASTASRRNAGFTPWPSELRPRLQGVGRFALQWNDDQAIFAERTLHFGGADTAIDLTDSVGRPLSVNKWGRLTASFATQDAGSKRRVLERTRTLLSALHDLDLEAFVVGGTLLGAVRSGNLLADDDDVDIAYLSEFTHPADLAMESFQVQRRLESLGFWVVRHDAAHLQVTYRSENGDVDQFIDIFTAFFKDGTFYEPIHVATDAVSVGDILPLSTVTIDEEQFPAPASPEAWLAACYGPHWRRPDPTFRFRTPQATIRRFHAWFGGQSTHRPFWDDAHREASADPVPSSDALAFAERLPPHSLVVDVACGQGADSAYFASLGHDVVAFDYSWVAIEAARARDTENRVDYRVLNLYSRRQIVELSIELRATGRPVYLYFRHALEGLTNSARLNAATLCRSVLTGESFARIVSWATLTPHFQYDNPETWHMQLRDQYKSALQFGLDVEVIGQRFGATDHGRRLILDTIVTRRKDN